MRRAPLLAAFALVLSVLALPALAIDGAAPPAGAQLVDLDSVAAAHWIGPDQATIGSPAEGENATLWIGFEIPAATPAEPNDGEPADPDAEPAEATPTNTTYRLRVQLTADEGIQATQTEIEILSGEGPWTYGTIQLATDLADDGEVTLTYTLQLTLESIEGDNVTELANATTLGTATFQTGTPAPIPTPPEGIPTTYIIGGAAALAVAIGGALALRNKRERDRRARQPRRSQALREEALERAAPKKPEQRAAVAAEIRQQEKVRERKRELQILDAKKADILKTLELLRKRHETGGLTKLQYDTMTNKKQTELTRLEAEIAEMEAADERGSAAA